jgi:hypothetical protein
MARKKNPKGRLSHQTGNVVEHVPTTSFGAAVGTYLGASTSGQQAVTYEKASCSCGGENENCFKCDGTGFYTKQVVEHSEDLRPPLSKLRNTGSVLAESSFSNDARGGEYGIRERGRYGSNPLHDDHE